MKKIIFAFLLGMILTSCGSSETKTVDTVDTVETATDEVDTTYVRVLTVYGDTVVVDTIQ